MATIYQLIIDDWLIKDDLYNNADDATDNAMQISKDAKKSVVIWEAEEVEGIPVDALEWSVYKIIWN